MEVDVIRAVLQIIDDSLLCSAVFPWAELAGVVTAVIVSGNDCIVIANIGRGVSLGSGFI